MAKLTTADLKKLPEHDFAFPKQRKEPLTSSAHVKDALARFNQVKDATNKERDEAWKRIKAAAKKFNVQVQEKDWRELFTKNGHPVPHE